MASAAHTSTKTNINKNYPTCPVQGSACSVDCDQIYPRSDSIFLTKSYDEEVFADGGCWANGHQNALAGFRLDFGLGDPRNCTGVSVFGKQTNNRAHASSVLAAVELTTKNVVIVTMSAITVCTHD